MQALATNALTDSNVGSPSFFNWRVWTQRVSWYRELSTLSKRCNLWCSTVRTANCICQRHLVSDHSAHRLNICICICICLRSHEYNSCIQTTMAEFTYLSSSYAMRYQGLPQQICRGQHSQSQRAYSTVSGKSQQKEAICILSSISHKP